MFQFDRNKRYCYKCFYECVLGTFIEKLQSTFQILKPQNFDLSSKCRIFKSPHFDFINLEIYIYSLLQPRTRVRCGRSRMIVEFTFARSAYHH